VSDVITRPLWVSVLSSIQELFDYGEISADVLRVAQSDGRWLESHQVAEPRLFIHSVSSVVFFWDLHDRLVYLTVSARCRSLLIAPIEGMMIRVEEPT
jgi:hypothetical protein